MRYPRLARLVASLPRDLVRPAPTARPVLALWLLGVWTIAASAAGCRAGSDGTPDADASTPCQEDRDCDDGVFCNGTETCSRDNPAADRNGCVAGTPPCEASCDEGGDRCASMCPVPDADGDGVASTACGGIDCDDSDPNRFPGNPEVCDSSHDEDCDPTTVGEDLDRDGYPSTECCNGSECGGDCDDTRAGVSPSATDGCGGGDENCDGRLDDEPDSIFYRDADSDNYGDPTDTVMRCALPAGYTVRAGDCDDNPLDDDPLGVPANERNEGRTELCNDVDDDCDGTIDEQPDGVGPCDCTAPGAGRPCGLVDPSLDGVGACSLGTQVCDAGTWGTCIGAVLPATEICDGVDNDCDGASDEGTTVQCWTDGDGDGVAPDAASATTLCGNTCPSGLTDVDPASLSALDCDDADPFASPELPEACDGTRDDDCDDGVDEGCACSGVETRPCGSGGAGLLGVCAVGDQACSGGAWTGCTSPGTIEESCNAADDDCDGAFDETWGCVDGTADQMEARKCDGTIHFFSSDPLSPDVPHQRSCVSCNWTPWVEADTDAACNASFDDCDGDIDEGYFKSRTWGSPCRRPIYYHRTTSGGTTRLYYDPRSSVSGWSAGTGCLADNVTPTPEEAPGSCYYFSTYPGRVNPALVKLVRCRNDSGARQFALHTNACPAGWSFSNEVGWIYPPDESIAWGLRGYPTGEAPLLALTNGQEMYVTTEVSEVLVNRASGNWFDIDDTASPFRTWSMRCGTLFPRGDGTRIRACAIGVAFPDYF